jgi:hypothetical protein
MNIGSEHARGFCIWSCDDSIGGVDWQRQSNGPNPCQDIFFARLSSRADGPCKIALLKSEESLYAKC